MIHYKKEKDLKMKDTFIGTVLSHDTKKQTDVCGKS